MAWIIFDNLKRLQLSASALNFAGDPLKVMLCTAAYVPNQTTDQFVTDVSSPIHAMTEVVGGNYTPGGTALASKTVTVAAHALTFDCADLLWLQHAAGFTAARIAVLYKDTGVAATSPLIAYYVLAEAKGNVLADLPMKTPGGIFTVPSSPTGFQLYDTFLLHQFTGVPVDFVSDPLKVMLATFAYVPDQAAHAFLADVSPEVVGNPYVAGGAMLTVGPVTVTGHVASFSVADVTWAQDAVNGYANAGYAVIYRNSGNPATSPLVAYCNLRDIIPAPYDIGNLVSAHGLLFRQVAFDPNSPHTGILQL